MAVQALTAGPYMSSRKGHEFHVKCLSCWGGGCLLLHPRVRPSHSSVYTIQIAMVSTHLRKQNAISSAIRW